MNCLDCHAAGSERTAVAVCRECGAAVCPAHAHLHTRTVPRGPAMGTPHEGRAARTVLCPVCSAAATPAAPPAGGARR